MPALILDQVSFAYSGGDDILTDLSFTCGTGWTALVGANGAGKTTLLSLVAGSVTPTRGHVRRPAGTIAVVDQRVDDPSSVQDLAWSFDKAALRWRSRFGLDADDLARWETLSPGERKRWQLAAALAGEPDLLIVDEPSNHLDADALAQTADALAAFPGIGLIVSHDRSLLDRLAYQTIRLSGGHARTWPGAYTHARACWEAEDAATRARREQLAGERRKAERLLADARRREASAHRMTSTRARMRNDHDSDAKTIGAGNLAAWAAAKAGRDVQRAHTRLGAAATAEESIVVGRERGATLSFSGDIAARRWVVQVDEPLRAGDRLLAPSVRVAVGRTERIWLRGANGAGKTTLLATLLARCTLPADRIFTLPQDLSRDAGATLAAELRALDPATRGRLGQLVDALGIDPARATSSAQPSPGESRKLVLALGLVREPQLVILDEPTNHLDLDSIERLEAALSDFPGALVLVSHDRAFATRLCTTTWTLADAALVVGAVE